MSDNLDVANPHPLARTLIGTDLGAQAVVVIFGQPVANLVLSPDQAEAFGQALVERARQLKRQINN